MKSPSLINRAVDAFHRYHVKLIRRRDASKVEGLPDYLLKDIGWPASTLDVCKDCTQ